MASIRLRQLLCALIVLVVYACTGPTALAAPDANLRVAKVTALTGEVKVQKAGGERSFAAFKNMGLTEGDSLITGPAASVTLALDEFKDVRIGENSHVLISELRIALAEDAEQSTFSLLAGGLWGSIRKQLNLDSRFQVKTANAVMGVRGTELYVRHTASGTVVDLVEGTITVASILPVENPDGTTGESLVETTLHAGQRVSLDAPALQIADFILEELTAEGLDLFALQVLAEMSETRPDLVSPERAAEVRQIIEQRKQQPTPPAPLSPVRRIVYDPAVIPPVEDDPPEEQPQLPSVSLQPLADQTVVVSGTVSLAVIAHPASASLSVTVDNEQAVEATVQSSGSTSLVELTGRQTGTYGVTVRASLAGHLSATRSFTLTVLPPANAAPTVSNLELRGLAKVGEMLQLQYTYADADRDAEGETGIQWYRSSQPAGADRQPISGANAKTYELQEGDEGQFILAEVTPKDAVGTVGESVFSSASGPVAAGDNGVEGIPVWQGTTVSWQPVAEAAGYRLTLYRQAWDANEPEACYQLDVNSGVTSFDFGELLQLADQRIHDQQWDHNPSGSAGYQVSVTSLGAGVYGDGPSLMTEYLWREAAPWVGDVELTLVEGPKNGDASDFLISFQAQADESNVAEYRVVLAREDAYPSLGELTALASDRYYAISPETTLPQQLPSGLLDYAGNALEVGVSYTAYVLTVPEADAQVYAYTESAGRTKLNCPGFRMVRATGEGSSVQLEFSHELASDTGLEAADFQVIPLVNGVRGSVCTIADDGGIHVSGRYVELYLDDYLGGGELPIVYQFEITLLESARGEIKAQSDQELTLSGDVTWWTSVVDQYPPEATVGSVNQDLNQVVLQFGDTPEGDRYNLQFPGEMTTSLLQLLDLKEWLIDGEEELISPLLAAHYQSDGRLVLQLRDADTAAYGQVELPLFIYDHPIYRPNSPGFRLLLTDQGSVWAADLLPPEVEC